MPQDGEPCGIDGWTGTAGWCADDHRCNLDADPPTCRPLPGVGEPCVEGEACASGLQCECDDAACTAHRCKRVRAVGQSCTDSNDMCLSGATRCEAGVCVGATDLQGLFERACMP